MAKETGSKATESKDAAPGARRHPRLAAALGVVALLLGGFAALSATRAGDLNGTAAARNDALSDSARTSEVKGQVADVINTVFSYNYTDVGKTDRAARTLLTGQAIRQYNELFDKIRNEAPAQKQILTTTVTDSAVQSLEGDRARLLVFADQRNTRTDKDKTSQAATMFAVSAVRQGGRWKVENIDTFKGGG